MHALGTEDDADAQAEMDFMMLRDPKAVRADIRDFGKPASPDEQPKRQAGVIIEESKKPVIAAINGTAMQLNLGTLKVTRMVVLTTDPTLRTAIQTRYVQQVWPGICQFAPEYCTAQTVPPSITVQPSSQSVVPGGAASFTVVAGGTLPLYYRWQKNNANLADGGHYAGSATATLTIANADTSDAASYRCVVTNTYGSVTSSVAILTVTTNQPCSPILNAGFENGFTLYGGSNIGNDWTQWESVPSTITGYDETTNVHSGANSQRIRLWNTAGGTSYAGVYQQVAVQSGASYTNSVWMYAYDTSSYCYLGVDPTGRAVVGGSPPGCGAVTLRAFDLANTPLWTRTVPLSCRESGRGGNRGSPASCVWVMAS